MHWNSTERQGGKKGRSPIEEKSTGGPLCMRSRKKGGHYLYENGVLVNFAFVVKAN